MSILHDDIILLLDETIRLDQQEIILDRESFSLYQELDINVLLDYSAELYVLMCTYYFPKIIELQQCMRIVSFFVCIKLYSDVILKRPYTFSWNVLVMEEYVRLDLSHAEFLELMLKFEKFFVKFI